MGRRFSTERTECFMSCMCTRRSVRYDSERDSAFLLSSAPLLVPEERPLYPCPGGRLVLQYFYSCPGACSTTVRGPRCIPLPAAPLVCQALNFHFLRKAPSPPSPALTALALTTSFTRTHARSLQICRPDSVNKRRRRRGQCDSSFRGGPNAH